MFQATLEAMAFIAAAFVVIAAANAAEPAPTYVGGAACMGCHREEAAHWRNSHHALSMQPASPSSVQGDFNNVTVRTTAGEIRFFRKNESYFANTEGPDGNRRDYEIRYAFGVFPLQQYLVEFPDGRLQALGIAWDSRLQTEGGQRWYALYPDAPPKPGDSVHWTGRDQNWNFMCAACHSTDLRKNYDAASNRFRTTWSEINVSCEACHGPGSQHVAWAKRNAVGIVGSDSDKGLLTQLRAGKELAWRFTAPEQAIAAPVGDLAVARRETESCFPCHARRQPLIETPTVGKPFLDGYQPSLLEQSLYHADGQIDGEVFEFGSFAQSKMYRAGVTCSNCHEPHSLKLRASGNALCVQCHRTDRYDRREHFHHPVGSSGAQCISCHMPAKIYMGVDQRRDHSFRVPHPELSASYGVPNACAQCHTDQPTQWAIDAVGRWIGKAFDPSSHPTTAIHAAWQASPAAERRLTALLASPAQSAILRATALSLLSPPFSLAARRQIADATRDADPLVRFGAARALVGLDAAEAIGLGGPLLADAVRSVRVEAARSLVGASESSLSEKTWDDLAKAVSELIAAEQASADRPESHVNLSQIYLRLGRVEEAEQELNAALKLDSRFVPAMVNFADFYRVTNQDTKGESWLQKAINTDPGHAGAIHALGLLRVRQGNRSEALNLLRQASELEPRTTRYTYVYAVALLEIGQGAQALAVLEKALLTAPDDASFLQARIAVERRLGREGEAARHQAEFNALAKSG